MLDILFWISIFSGGLLIVLLGFSLIGGSDVEVELGGDSEIDAGGLGIVKSGLFFFALCSWVFRLLLLYKQPTYISLTGGIIVGLIGVYLLSKLFKFLLTQVQDNTWDFDQAINSEGSVYLKIPVSGEGIVKVEINGKIFELKAITKDGKEIPTGANVFVQDVENQKLVVSQINH